MLLMAGQLDVVVWRARPADVALLLVCTCRRNWIPIAPHLGVARLRHHRRGRERHLLLEYLGVDFLGRYRRCL
jgi:hypothetical protein